jgi:hypothetical protein
MSWLKMGSRFFSVITLDFALGAPSRGRGSVASSERQLTGARECSTCPESGHLSLIRPSHLQTGNSTFGSDFAHAQISESRLHSGYSPAAPTFSMRDKSILLISGIRSAPIRLDPFA